MTQENGPNPFLLTREEAAMRYGVSQRVFDNLYRRHADFPVIRVGKKVLVPITLADAWFEARVGEEITV